MLLSAATPEALEALVERTTASLRGASRSHLVDAAYTLRTGRRQLAERAFWIASPGASRKAPCVRRATAGARGIAFLFPGQGSEFRTMGRALYDSDLVYRKTFDACNEIIRDESGLDIQSVVGYGADGERGATRFGEPKSCSRCYSPSSCRSPGH